MQNVFQPILQLYRYIIISNTAFFTYTYPKAEYLPFSVFHQNVVSTIYTYVLIHSILFSRRQCKNIKFPSHLFTFSQMSQMALSRRVSFYKRKKCYNVNKREIIYFSCYFAFRRTTLTIFFHHQCHSHH